MGKHAIFLFLFISISMCCKSQENRFDEQGRRHGPWKVNFEGTEKPKFEGNFEHGKEIGIFKFYKQGFYDHPSAIMEFKENMDSVQVIYFTQAGKPISTGKMVERKREGEWLYFHQDSDSIMMRETYRENKLNGLQKTYYPNGQLAEKTAYTGDKKNGECFIYTAKGELTKHLNFKDGLLHGPAVYYNLNGKMTMQGYYDAGKKSGKWKYYSEGELEKTEDY